MAVAEGIALGRRPVRVLIVDDSIVVRTHLTILLRKDPGIEVVGTACDAHMARDKIAEMKPDVLTLDVEMPRVDGLTFLEWLMREHPMPVVMCSSLTREGCGVALRALELGAVDIVQKASSNSREGLAEVSMVLCDKIKAAANCRVRRLVQPARTFRSAPAPASASTHPKPRLGHGPALAVSTETLERSRGRMIAIGASTGGTEALRAVLERLPADCPPILIVQHMPEHFTRAFAERLNSLCQIEVKEASDGDPLLIGRALIAPGNRHMLLRQAPGGGFAASIKDGPLVCRHRPSVEVLFNSVARAAGPRAIGVMLTGMGGDGSDAMLAMRQAGAWNVAQDEASCVVFGMPREAIRKGAVHQVESLQRIPEAIFAHLSRS